MKKFIVFLFVFGLISAAFAEDTTKMTASVSGVVYGTTFQTAAGGPNDKGDFSEGRIQPLFTITNGTMDVVFKFRFDQTFGKDDRAAGADSDAFGSASRKNDIKIMNAYVKSKVDAVPGLTLAGGIMIYDYPILYSDNMAMFNATYDAGMAKLALYYGKTSENDKKSSQDDAQVYIADLTVKLGASSLRPAFFLYKQGKNASTNPDDDMANFDGSTGYIYALAGNIVVDSFGVDFTTAYSMGNQKIGTTTQKMTGYALDVAPYYKVNSMIKTTAFMTMISGDNGSSSTKNTSFRNTAIDPTSGLNVVRLYILEDGASYGKNSDVCGAADMKYRKDYGYMAYGLALDAAVGPFTAKLQGAYAVANKVATGMKKDLGIELDANVGYALTKGSTLFVEGGFLKSGKYFDTATDKANNAYYVMGGISYSI